MLRLLGGLTALALLATTGAGLWLRGELAAVGAEGTERPFTVERGDSLGRVARRLEMQGLIRNAHALELWGRLGGRASQLQAGDYRVSQAQSAGDILDHFVEGRIVTYPVVVPEGFTAAQIGARLAAEGFVPEQAFLAAVHDAELAQELGVPADDLEGYLYPETYRMRKGLPAEEVARLMVEHFQAAWEEIEAGARERGLSMHEVVTLASVVEKETGAAQERPVIASVFSNRLERGMRLESDPTIIYGIPDFDGNLRRRDLDNTANLYNTYQHAGLPPGPIANPGLGSLRAVVNPAESDFLFFVSRNDGTHKFSKTYREHVNAVNHYQRRLSRQDK